MVVFYLTDCSPSRIRNHQLLPPVGSVLAILAPAQLIPVHLIKLPPVNSLFLGCTSQQETAKFNPSPAAADGKATINLREMRYSLSIPRGAMELWKSLSVMGWIGSTLCHRESQFGLSQRPWRMTVTALLMLLNQVKYTDKDFGWNPPSLYQCQAWKPFRVHTSYCSWGDSGIINTSMDQGHC